VQYHPRKPLYYSNRRIEISLATKTKAFRNSQDLCRLPMSKNQRKMADACCQPKNRVVRYMVLDQEPCNLDNPKWRKSSWAARIWKRAVSSVLLCKCESLHTLNAQQVACGISLTPSWYQRERSWRGWVQEACRKHRWRSLGAGRFP